jgi:hypothetical protein
MIACQKTKKWNCGCIHRITWNALSVFEFFLLYHVEFPFYSCSVDVLILRYGHIFPCVRKWGRGGYFVPAGYFVHYCTAHTTASSAHIRSAIGKPTAHTITRSARNVRNAIGKLAARTNARSIRNARKAIGKHTTSGSGNGAA